MNVSIPTKQLSNQAAMPTIGFGTWKLSPNEARVSVEFALREGYTHIDCSPHYGNQNAVGEAIDAVTNDEESDLHRNDIFVVSKKWFEDLSPEAVHDELEMTLDELGLEYLDCYLIHWPNHDYDIVETLDALQEEKEAGRIRSIGVSNFTIEHLKEIEDRSEVTIDVNQVEYHPLLNQEELREYCQGNDIVLEAYSPLAHGEIFGIEVIDDIADQYDVSEAQVILNWLRAHDIVAIPRSSSKKHILDNLASLQWELLPEDVEKIDRITAENPDLKRRIVKPGMHEFDFKYNG